MFGTDYALGYSQGRSSAEDERDTKAIIARVIYGQRPVTVDQSYIDQLHAALARARDASAHNHAACDQFQTSALEWEDKARLKERNPDLAEEQAAHDETFKEKQSLQRFRVIAASLIDALLAGRADRPEFAELLTIAKDAADTIERGDLFTAFRDEPEKSDRLCSLADALQKT